MIVNEDDYWPAEMVNELKVLVRKEKFHFDVVSEKLKIWLRSCTSLDSADKSSFDINPKTCREAFARDYSKAPYNKNKEKASTPVKVQAEPSEEVKSQSSPTTTLSKPPQQIVSLSAEDEMEASKFTFDTLDQDGQRNQENPAMMNVKPLPETPGPDLTYEEVLANAERIEEENYKRKEAVFTKVAKILMLNEDEEGGESSESSDISKPMNAMDAQVIRAFQEGRRKREEEKIRRKKEAADAEEWRKIKEDRERLRRRFEEGSEDAEGEAFNFGQGAPGAGVGTSQANEEAEKALYEHYVRSMIGAATAPSSESLKESETSQVMESGAQAPQVGSDSKEQVHQELYRQLIVDTIAAKYHGELSAVRDGMSAVSIASEESSSSPSSPQGQNKGFNEMGRQSLSSGSVNLSGGFLESTEFEEILSSLEAEQAATAQQKGGNDVDEGSGDLADVLAILDAAAAGKIAGGVEMPSSGTSKADDDGVSAMMREMASFEVPEASYGSTSGKVLLRAGMGTARRPEDSSTAGLPPPPPIPSQKTTHNPVIGRTGSSLQESKEGNDGRSNAFRDARVRGEGSSAPPRESEEDGDDSESSDDDADSNWKSRRAAAKAKAAKGAFSVSSAVGAGNVPSGVYGFGGMGTALPSRSKRGAAGSGVSVERSSDKILLPPGVSLPDGAGQSPDKNTSAGDAESKGETAMSSTPAPESSIMARSNPTSVESNGSLTPDLDGTWSEVLSPPVAGAGSGTNLSREVEAEAEAEDIAPVQVGDAISVQSVGGGMLSGRSGATRSKGKKPMMKRI